MILCTLHYIVRLMEKTILNFKFDYLHPSLIIALFSENFTTFSTGFNHCNFLFPSRSRSFPRMEASDSLPEFWEWIFFIPFPFPNFGNGFFYSLPVPELWEWIFLFPSRSRISGMGFFNSLPVPEFREWFFLIPFPFPNFGNGFFQFPSRSRILKSHSFFHGGGVLILTLSIHPCNRRVNSDTHPPHRTPKVCNTGPGVYNFHYTS